MAPSKRLSTMAKTWNLEPLALKQVVASTAIARAHRMSNRVTDDVISDLGLTKSRYEILVTVYFETEPALSLSHLSKGLTIHPATLTYTIDQLAAAKLLTRKNHETDRRVVLVELTPSGRALVEKANAMLAQVSFGVPGLTAKECETVIEILGKMSDRPAATSPG